MAQVKEDSGSEDSCGDTFYLHEDAREPPVATKSEAERLVWETERVAEEQLHQEESVNFSLFAFAGTADYGGTPMRVNIFCDTLLQAMNESTEQVIFAGLEIKGSGACVGISTEVMGRCFDLVLQLNLLVDDQGRLPKHVAALFAACNLVPGTLSCVTCASWTSTHCSAMLFLG